MLGRASFFVAFLTLASSAAADTCKQLWKHIDFEQHLNPGPYVEEMAELDFLPASYLDGTHSDPSTKGSTNERAFIRDANGGRALEVLLPKGCVTSACAMQAKMLLPQALEEATLVYKVRFGPDFDWVRGGKLPGLCGARCLTGCKTVTGLDGFSARSMFRPINWPPVHESKELKATGGKLTAYVYHMYKEHWCGDDFDYENEKFAAKAADGVPFQNFQPDPETWYEIRTTIAMNTAGDPGKPEDFQTDGILRTWLDGTLVVDKTDMSWRKFNNVTIDTLYFSVFFGGSSESFQARKDETIQFDDFMIYEGECTPTSVPEIKTLATIQPVWEGQRPKIETDLKTSVVKAKTFVGGGCGQIAITNEGAMECEDWQLEVNIRPSWGSLNKWSGVTLIEENKEAGWYSLGPDTALITDTSLKVRETKKRASMCIQTTIKAKFLPSQFTQHVTANAYCVKRGGQRLDVTGAPNVAPENRPMPTQPSNPDADTTEDTLPIDDLTNNTDCKGDVVEITNEERFYSSKVCINSDLTYTGAGECAAFNVNISFNELGSQITSFRSTRMDAVKDDISGGVLLKNPAWMKPLECGQTHTTQTCFSIKKALKSPIESIVATCTQKAQPELIPTMEDTSAEDAD